MAIELVGGVFATNVVQELIDTIKSFAHDQYHHVLSDLEIKLKNLEMSYTKVQLARDHIDGRELVNSHKHQIWVGDAMTNCYNFEDLMVDFALKTREMEGALSFLQNWCMSQEMVNLQYNLDLLSIAAANRPPKSLARMLDVTPDIDVDFKRMRDKVLSSVIVQASPETEKIIQEQGKPPQQRLFRDLSKRAKVLIVLDDLYNFPDPQEWEVFESFLFNSPLMFGVIITTRNPEVTRLVTSLSTVPMIAYHLKRLSTENIQSIILPNSLKAISLKVAENLCKGLLLVANIIRLHISSVSEDRWSSIQLSDLWDMPKLREQLFPSIELNYTNLSRSLRNCFCYLSLFPVDFHFHKEDLVRYWMSEGFIEQECPGNTYGHARLEEIGNDWFHELLSRSTII
uniref:Disease resistance protein winged helix domain-containing protein n=1 Tax=Chenopodium quinoa TaxID=63459 RepID=A0A803LT83_CHEQI